MRFLADENFNNDILRGILNESPDFDVIRAQDTEIYEADDAAVLAWAADEGRMLLTHDVKTITPYVQERVKAGLPMPGVIIIRQQVPLGEAIEALHIFIGASDPEEWENQVTYLPLH